MTTMTATRFRVDVRVIDTQANEIVSITPLALTDDPSVAKAVYERVVSLDLTKEAK